jgi:hypothetical protein
MDSRKAQRRLIIVVGLLASLITILAGGFRGQLIPIHEETLEVCQQECDNQNCDHSKEQKTYVSAPAEAIPGSSASTVFDCPSCGEIKPETSVPIEESQNVVIRFVNTYFKTLVRSLIRTNAP